MLKYNEIVEKLTIKQKISLLTDIRSLSNPAMNEAGVPYVSVASVEKLLAKAFCGLSPSRLANSWNAELIRSASREAVEKHEATGASLIVTPAAKPGLSVYQTALSEDPYLSGKLACAYADGVGLAGGACCLDGFYLTGADTEQLDIEPDMAAIGEMVVKSYMIAAGNKGYKGVISVDTALSGAYKDVNESLMTSNSVINMLNGKARLCVPRDDNATLTAILDGKIVLRGGASALESACENYRYILNAIENEVVTAEDLDEALEDGSAVSDEMLNRAVCRVLEFAESISESEHRANDVKDSVKKSAIAESCVLLKNENRLLPIKAKSGIAVFGDASTDADFVQALCEKTGLKAHVKLVDNENESKLQKQDIEEIRELAKASDYVLVFLGTTHEMGKQAVSNRELTLPAKQVELLHALGEHRKKLVGIVDCDYSVDMSFATYLPAVLMASTGDNDCAEVLADILMGRECPSGRLASTLYENASEHFARLKKCKDLGKNKVGQFWGYRHYDISELDIKFPFGHGLSYTTFEYSNLRTSPQKIAVTVKNKGKTAGAEVVQVYIGKTDSSRVRPLKQLCGFEKVFLKPGESREVQIDISDFAFYDPNRDKWIRENGAHMVYVGSSVKDVRVSGTVLINGETYEKCSEKSSDYLQAHTNIITDEYLTEVRLTKPAKQWKLKLFAIIAAALAVLSFAAANPNTLTYVSGGVMLITAVVLLIIDGVRRNKIRRNLEAEKRMGKQKYLDAAEQKEFDSIEELFVEEFDVVSEEQEASVEEQAYVDDTARYIDLGYSLSDAASDLERFMRERGMAFTAMDTMQLISAMAASRLIIADVEGVDKEHFYGSLAEYFGCPLCVETFRSEHADTHLMFSKNEDGAYEKTGLVKLIENAKENKNTVHIAVLRGVGAEALLEAFMPYLKYFSNPIRENRVIVKEPTAHFVLPSNLWFIAELSADEQLRAADPSILKVASALELRVAECDKADEASEHRGIGYYQIDHLVQQQKGRFYMSEELWKKIDSLEAYMASYVPYRIGNKQWLQMEKYLSILTLAETDIFAALDRAMCANLLPEITALLKDKVKSGDKDLLEAIEQFFGEDKLPLCAKMAKGQPTSKT